MSYKVIIPSYKRADIIQSHTLKALAETDIKAEIIVFVADENELEQYKSIRGLKIIQGVRGIPNQRNFIQRSFKEGERLVFIDDDIKRIVGLDKAGKRVKATKVHDFILKAFEQTEKIGFKMWGINSTSSNLEMKQQVSAGRIYIVGNFYGLINTHKVFVDEGECIKKRLTYEAGKESHERALKMTEKFGGVLKYRAFGVDSAYYGVKGGHQVSRNFEGEEEATNYLNRRYPTWTTVRNLKGMPDLVIKPKTKVFKTAFFQ